ncbi:MAG: hypothetical protein WAW52_14610 [Methanothrix sp.]
MKKMFLALVLVLMLSPIALAKNENLKIGHYNVSFDLNTNKRYNIEDPYSKERETFEGDKNIASEISIKDERKNIWLIFSIVNYGSVQNIIFETTKNDIIRDLKGFAYNDVTIYNRTIDSCDGVLGVGSDDKGYRAFLAIFWPDSYLEGGVFKGRTKCVLLTHYDWDVVSDLLNSINVTEERT